MNIRHKRVPTKFGPEIGFGLRPARPALPRALEAEEFRRLKNRLLSERLEAAWEPRSNRGVSVAANEAAALAWVTPYPLLVFPVLFEEKAGAALRHARRQGEVLERSRALLVA